MAVVTQIITYLLLTNTLPLVIRCRQRLYHK